MTQRDELAAAEAKATPGPWEAPLKDLGAVESFKAVDFYFDHSFEAYPPLGERGPVFVANSAENTNFITLARNAMPGLLKALAEAEQQRDAQMEDTARHLRNQEWLCGLLVQIGGALGEEAKTCDDGSRVPHVLIAKVPELVEEAQAKLTASEAALAEAEKTNCELTRQLSERFGIQDKQSLAGYAFTTYGGDAKLYNGIYDLQSRLDDSSIDRGRLTRKALERVINANGKAARCKLHTPLRFPLCAHCQLNARIEEAQAVLAQPAPAEEGK